MFRRTIATTAALSVAFALGAFAQEGDVRNDPARQGDEVHKDRSEAEQPMTIEHVLNKLHMSNQKEIHMANMALEKTDNAGIKDYANLLIADHTKAEEQVKQVAAAKNVTLKDTMKHDHDKAETHNSNPTPDPNRTPNEHADAPDEGKAATPQSGGNAKVGTAGNEAASTTSHPDRNDGLTVDEEKKHKAEKHKEMMDRLHNASGEDFDRQYLAMMVEGHEKLLDFMTKAKSEVGDDQVKGLIDQLQPTVQAHQDKAKELKGKAGDSDANAQNDADGASERDKNRSDGSADKGNPNIPGSTATENSGNIAAPAAPAPTR